MLGKLFKHEMKATSRLLLPLYLVLAVLTVMDRIVIYLDIFKGVLSIIPGLITFAYVVSLIAIIIVSSVIIIYRFYKNLMTDEGYLMFTLPAKPHELINSKLFASIIWSVASIVAVAASIMLVVSGSINLTEIWDALKQGMSQLRELFEGTLALFIIEIIVMIIISIVNSILMVYVSVAIGQLFSGHKVIGSFAAYIGITTVIQIIVTIGTMLLSWIFRGSFNEISAIPLVLLPIMILFMLALSAAYYWLTDFIFRKKLNLE
jgi:hypothetical protein